MRRLNKKALYINSPCIKFFFFTIYIKTLYINLYILKKKLYILIFLICVNWSCIYVNCSQGPCFYEQNRMHNCYIFCFCFYFYFYVYFCFRLWNSTSFKILIKWIHYYYYYYYYYYYIFLLVGFSFYMIKVKFEKFRVPFLLIVIHQTSIILLNLK